MGLLDGIAAKLRLAGLKRPIAISPKDCLFLESRLFGVDIIGSKIWSTLGPDCDFLFYFPSWAPP